MWGWLKEVGHFESMVYLILCESLPHLLEYCEWGRGNVCYCLVKYVCIGSLDLESGLGCVDVFVWVAFFDIHVKCGASMGV